MVDIITRASLKSDPGLGNNWSHVVICLDYTIESSRRYTIVPTRLKTGSDLCFAASTGPRHRVAKSGHGRNTGETTNCINYSFFNVITPNIYTRTRRFLESGMKNRSRMAWVSSRNIRFYTCTRLSSCRYDVMIFSLAISATVFIVC